MSELNQNILSIFNKHGSDVSALPYSLCKVANTRLADSLSFIPKSVIIFTIPYFSGYQEGNLSLYARGNDYHLYFKEISPILKNELLSLFPNNSFQCYADHSPINEVNAAARAGLGVIGENGMLITDKYASFVFIGSVITDVEFDLISTRKNFEITFCEKCGKCKEACPAQNGRECLSALTQKKGQLTKDEQDYIKEYGSVWGCDICQLVCPHVQKVIQETCITPIDFFKKERINTLDLKTLSDMDKKQFSKRAFSWRGKSVIERNIKIWEK